MARGEASARASLAVEVSDYMVNPRALPTVSFQVFTQSGSTLAQVFAQVGNTAVELALPNKASSSLDGLTIVILNGL